MATENKPISALYPLVGDLTPNDLMVISQEEPEGWQSYNVAVSKFVDLVIKGMNDGSVFLRKVHTVDGSGLTGSGTVIDAMGLDWSVLDARFAPNDVGGGYVPKTTQIVAGAGLKGGGQLDANRTITMGTPSTITGNTNNSVGGETHTHAIESASTQNAGVVKLVDDLSSTSNTEAASARLAKLLNDTKVDKAITITAGNGMTGGGNLGSNLTIALGVPSTITELSRNSTLAGTHSHEIDVASTTKAGIVKLNDSVTSGSVSEAATAKVAKALNDNKADKTTTLSTGWGLTGGGNLTDNRQIGINTDQLDTRYAPAGIGGNYVPITRTVSAGTGLTGGGNLGGNITISCNFGTVVNTVAMGNDNRILNGQTAYSWGDHASQNYLRLTNVKTDGGILGNGTLASPLEVDFSNLNQKYLSLNGGTIDGDLTINGKLNAPNLDTGVPLGSVMWWAGPRSTIPDGWVASDGQLGLRADFPDLWNMINTGRLNRVTDAAWVQLNGSQNVTQRACYSLGTTTDNFRFPDLNGKQTGSWKSPVLRGDGYKFGGPGMNSNGYILGDAIRNITGTGNYGIDANMNVNDSFFDGAIYYDYASKWFDDLNAATWSNAWSAREWYKMRFDASRSVPTSDENRPVSAFGVYIIKARGGTSNVPAAGAAASLLANIFNGSQKIIGDLEIVGQISASQWLDFINLKEDNGYQKLPRGLILQWGKTMRIGDEGKKTVPFNIAFPNKCLCIQLTENMISTNSAHASHVIAYDETLIDFKFFMNSTMVTSTSCNWFAIGH